MDNIENRDNFNIENENIEEQLYEIEVKMQEIDAKIERFEDALYERNEEIFSYEEYLQLKEEYKNLKKVKKAISKQKKGKWDNIPVWMFAYGVFQIIFSFFMVLNMASILFAEWFLGMFSEITKFWSIVGFFMLPLISVLLSLIIFLLIKDKARKKFFLIIFSIQFIETVIAVIIMASIMAKS